MWNFGADVLGADFWRGCFGCDLLVWTFWCGLFGVDLFARIFSCRFLGAADLLVWISVRILTRIFLIINWGSQTAGRATKNPQTKILPKILTKSLPAYLPASPHIHSKRSWVHPWMPLRSLTQCLSFLQNWTVVDAGLAGWC